MRCKRRKRLTKCQNYVDVIHGSPLRMARDVHDKIPLVRAAEKGSKRAAAVLLKSGHREQLGSTDMAGQTPLHRDLPRQYYTRLKDITRRCLFSLRTRLEQAQDNLQK